MKLPTWNDGVGITNEDSLNNDDQVVLRYLFQGSKILDISYERYEKINNQHQDYLTFLLQNPQGKLISLECMTGFLPDNEKIGMRIGEVEYD